MFLRLICTSTHTSALLPCRCPCKSGFLSRKMSQSHRHRGWPVLWPKSGSGVRWIIWVCCVEASSSTAPLKNCSCKSCVVNLLKVVNLMPDRVFELIFSRKPDSAFRLSLCLSMGGLGERMAAVPGQELTWALLLSYAWTQKQWHNIDEGNLAVHTYVDSFWCFTEYAGLW